MNIVSKIAVAAGAGLGVFLLATREAYGTESTGSSLPASAGYIPSGTPVSLGARAVAVGLRLVGTKEDPKGSNRGPAVDQIVRGVNSDGEKLLGKAWCARFVRFCFETAAKEMGLSPPFAGIKDSLAQVTSWRDTFKRWSTDDPRTGCVALLLSGGRSHATLVVRREGDQIVTCEGNHNDQVAIVSRPRSAFTIFLDIDRYCADRARSASVSGSGALLGLDVFTAW